MSWNSRDEDRKNQKTLMLHVNSEGIVLMSFVVCKFFHHLPKHGDRFMTLPTYCDITRIFNTKGGQFAAFYQTFYERSERQKACSKSA